jgi:Rrf2 family protein
MQITRQADYAVRAVLYLARCGSGTPVATAEIALAQKIPATFLTKIISQLSTAGVLRTTRGAHGGVALARSANDISLLEIVETIDGPVLLNSCVLDPASCPESLNCPVQKIWCQAQADLIMTLERTKFGQLVKAPALKLSFAIPALP